MSRRFAPALALATFVAAPRATAFELGLESGLGGTVATNVPQVDYGSSSPSGGSSVGLFVEQSVHPSRASIDFWADLQTPLSIAVWAGNSAGYLPIDLGVRAGPVLKDVEPYGGAFAELLLRVQTPELSQPLNAAVLGAGGDVGVDFAVFSFRVGLEARVARLLTPLSTTGSEGVWQFLGLLSFRYAAF